MCTVTYLPTGKDAFLFTSNRDEAPGRAASGIQSQLIKGKKVLFPQDELAQGTWIATASSNQMVCVLNGAFSAHRRNPPYRLSRGLMALQFFEYRDATHFFDHFPFEGLEPFTFIIYDQGRLYDLRWDENAPKLQQLALDESHIWSSCTLYEPARQKERERWFAEWKKEHPSFRSADILHFHQNGGQGDPAYNLVMNRWGLVQTTSITHLRKSPEKLEMHYLNLLRRAEERAVLALE